MKKVVLVAATAGVGSVAYFSMDSRSSLHSSITMPLMHLLDPETAHVAAIKSTSYGLSPRDQLPDPAILHTQVWGKEFSNPVGVAAGFDKHAEAIDGLFGMGFGFVEVGSVTPLPQAGNPKPRFFRLPEDRAVINRYGFNSHGADVVQGRLQRRAEKLAASKAAPGGILGVNLGKNKEQTDAAADYVTGLQKLGAYADYIVINVSSPNTPGLRSLQGEKELGDLIGRVKKARDEISWKGGAPPLLVKIAPDLTEEDKQQIARVVLLYKIDGLIISNTTVSREGLSGASKNEVGGMSGKPLFEKATAALADMYILTKGAIPIIGAGGVSNGKEAYEKIRKGASLVQIYTALGYDGPALVPRVKEELAECLRKDGFTSISQAIGIDSKKK